jgi:hypothetical protein
VTTAGMLRGATAPGHRTAASCHRRRACKKNGQQQRTVVRGRDPGMRWLQRKTGEIHCTYMDSPLDYPRWVVQRRVLARSVRLWLTRQSDGAHTSASPPWRWWAPHDPVGWAARTHAARHAEIAELFARPELAHAHRLRFSSPRQAAVWLLSLKQ